MPHERVVARAHGAAAACAAVWLVFAVYGVAVVSGADTQKCPGVCMSTSACTRAGYTFQSGVCPGDSSIACCMAPTPSCPGTCIDQSALPNACDGDIVPNGCTEFAAYGNIQCCRPRQQLVQCSKDQTALNEGWRACCYLDTANPPNPTIGIGLNIRADPAFAQSMFDTYAPGAGLVVSQVIADCQLPASQRTHCLPDYASALNIFNAAGGEYERQYSGSQCFHLREPQTEQVVRALADVNMGGSLSHFRSLGSALAKRDYVDAARQLRNTQHSDGSWHMSRWCNAVRARRCAIDYYCLLFGAAASTPVTSPLQPVISKFASDTARSQFIALTTAFAGTRDDWTAASVAPYDSATVVAGLIAWWAYEVAWQETQMQNIAQNGGGPGRGYFQYELAAGGSGANKIAVNRAVTWLTANAAVSGGVPQWLAALKGLDVDFTTLTFEQQLLIFVLDKNADAGAHLAQIVAASNDWSSHEQVFYQNWITGHWKGSGTPPAWRGSGFTVDTPLPPAGQ